jgi:integrase
MARKSFKASYVELRHKTYFAVFYIPKDVQVFLGKTKFYKSTKTSDLMLAEKRAAALVLGWQAQIVTARAQSEDPIISSALDLLKQSTEQNKRAIVNEIIDEEESRIRDEKGDVIADAFKTIATGQFQVLSTLMQRWKEHQVSKGLKQKTIDQMYSDIEILIDTFPTANYLTPDKIEAWIKNIALEANLSPSSVSRIIGSCRNFYKFLQFIGEVPKKEVDPFVIPDEYKITKKKNKKGINVVRSWVPFMRSDVVSLYKKAVEQGDLDLSNLIFIAAYSGARIEEICSIKCSNVDINNQSINIVDSKTSAGIRVVPIHSKLLPKIRELINDSKDGYLISGLTFNKYDDRSNAIGKRFGRLKNKCGYSRDFVFHSIRKTVTTELENTGTTENLAADILGHEKPRITYGLYSGGASLQNKKAAIEKITFDF